MTSKSSAATAFLSLSMVDQQYELTSYDPSAVTHASKMDIDLLDKKTASKFSFPVLVGSLGHQNKDTLSLA